MSERAHAPGRRRGSAILAALFLLGVLTVFAGFQQYLARQSVAVVQRAHLASLAVLQGHSGVEELVDQVVKRANDPSTPLYRAFRKAIRQPWTEIDLTAHLDAPRHAVLPSWGRPDAPPTATRGELEARVVEHKATLRAPRYLDAAGGSEEFVAVLTLSTIAEATTALGSVQRRASATYELRALKTTPPAPMDQAGIFVENAGAVAGVGGVGQHRSLLIQDHEAFRLRLQEVADTQAGEVAERLRELAAGMRGAEFLEEHAKRFAEAGDAILFGPIHGREVTAEGLDLVRQLRRLKADREQKVAAFEAAASDPAALGAAGYEVVSALGRELNQFRLYASRYAILARDVPKVAEQLLPYLDRLSPEFFRGRVHTRLPADDPLVARWAAGEVRLNGVVELLPAGSELTITGRPRGQLVLVTGTHPVRLQGAASGEAVDRPEDAIPDRLVVVSLGGNVSVSGDVRAAVLMLPPEDGGTPGQVQVASGATLTGNLTVANAQVGTIALAGKIRHDSAMHAPSPNDTRRLGPSEDPYTIVMSPTPLF